MGGGFGRRSSSSSSSSSGWARQGSPSSYPRQSAGRGDSIFGSAGTGSSGRGSSIFGSAGTRSTGRTGGGIGSAGTGSAGGFVKPGTGNSASSYGSRGLGGGGFVAPKPISRGRTALPGGRLLDRQPRDMGPTGGHLFQAELASTRAKASPRRLWDWGSEQDSSEELLLGWLVPWPLLASIRGTTSTRG